MCVKERQFVIKKNRKCVKTAILTVKNCVPDSILNCVRKWLVYNLKGVQFDLFLRYFYNFGKMLVHLKLQTCFVLPGLSSAIGSFQKIPLKLNEFDPVILYYNSSKLDMPGN